MMATYLFYKGRSLHVARMDRPTGRLRAYAETWVCGKPKRRVVIWVGSEHFTIRGTATGKDR